MPGPRPTPTTTLARRGSWRANERSDEPTPAVASAGDCIPPKNLPRRAKVIWRSLVPGLQAAGLLTLADLPTFARYCRIYAAWEAAMKQVEDGPDRAAVLTLSKLDEMLRKLESGFGLSPADRVGLKVEQPAPNAGKARFFG
jgi:phage terminase small subunit